jgi:hypothetical protein
MDYYYENLYAAIWQLAVKEDLKKICGMSVKKLIGKGVDLFEAKKYIDSKEEYIKSRVQKNIYQEAMEWGSGRSKEIQKENINALVAEVVDGYEKEVSETDKKATGRKRKVANKS